MNLNPILQRFAMMIMILSMAGCEVDKDDRLVEMSGRHERRQAEQTQQANQLHREVTAMQREVQAERTAIGQQRDQLETDRRSLANERRYDSLTAAAIINAGLWIACLLPLVIVWHLLRQPDAPADDHVIIDVLLGDLVADHPQLLSRLPSVSSNARRLPSESQVGDDKTA